MVFPNLYYKRTAATAKACYICYKPTVTVLATVDTTDFFYTCPVHLSDRGFATRAPDPDPEPKPSVSPEEITKVKQEWEEKQRLKKDKTPKKDSDGGQVDGEGKNGEEGAQNDVKGKEADAVTKPESKQEKKPANVGPSSSEDPTPRPTHERYVLHRDIFVLRTADHRRRRQTAQAKDLAPRFPGAPRSAFP